MILNNADKPNPEAVIPTLIQPNSVAPAQPTIAASSVTMPEDRIAAFRTSVANRLRDVTVKTSAENPTALIQAQEAVTVQIANEQRALIAALSDHDFAHAMASAYIAEMGVQQPNPDYIISMPEAHREVESILKNRIADCKEFITLLSHQDFITAMRSEAAQPAPAPKPYALSPSKIEETVEELVQAARKAGPQPAVHVASFARGQRMTHQALANIFRPKAGSLRAPLVDALTKTWPQATGEQIQNLTVSWLKDRHDPAHSTADGLKLDGVIYQEAMRRAEEFQAKKLGQTAAEQAAAKQATATIAKAQASSATALASEQPAATINVRGVHEGVVQQPQHDVLMEP